MSVIPKQLIQYFSTTSIKAERLHYGLHINGFFLNPLCAVTVPLLLKGTVQLQ